MFLATEAQRPGVINQENLHKYKNRMSEEELDVVENMERFGGSFVKALSGAFYRADRENFLKLKDAFPEYWDEYENFSK